MTTSAIGTYKNLPALFLNNRPIPAISAYVPHKYAGAFQKAGVTLYTALINTPWWVGPDIYDFTQIDAYVSEYVERVPNGYLMPRIDFAPQGYPWWGEGNTSEMVVLRSIATGEILNPSESDPRGETHLHHGIYLKGLNLHSFHSIKWRKDAGQAIAALIRHTETQPYADRIWGWHLCDGWPQEWFHWSEYLLNGLADYSPASKVDFQRWLRATYDEAVNQLQNAWGRDVNFEKAKIPEPSERVRTTHGEFYDPIRDRPTIDYTQCMSDAMVDSIIAVCSAAKEAMSVPKVVCVFYGYPFCHLPRPQLIGHNALAKLLASHAVDLIASPHSYDNRGEGGYHSPQAMADSARRANKMHFDEVDCKTVWTPKLRWKDHISHPTTVIGTIEMMKKDAAYQITSASGQWWCDLMGQGWFDTEEAAEVICKMKAIEERVLEMGRSSFGEIALVVSERSQIFQAPKDGLIDATREMFRNWHLSRMGAPFEQLLLSDLAHPTIPHYKLYIMADLFYLSAEERELIERVVKRDGSTVLWVYAPGYLDDHSASLANMQKITGIRFGMKDTKDELNVYITRFDHPFTAGLPEGMAYGTGVNREQYTHTPKIQYLPDTQVTPAFFVDDPDAEILGRAESTGQPGLAIKDMGTWRSIYSAAPAMSWLLMRNLARWAGVHLYNEQGDMLWANDRFLALYAQHDGLHTLRFPHPVTVVEAYDNRLLASSVTQLELPLKQWETRLLLYE